MQIEQISDHIWKLSSRLVIPVSVWVVKDDDGITLVDTGVSMMSKKILQFIQQLNAGPLQHILLTHGHPDHIGGLTNILKSLAVPVYVHHLEIPYIVGERPFPGKKRVKSYVNHDILSPLSKKGTELACISGMQPYLTPGHAPGHVVYYHRADKVLIAGDLFTSKKGELRRPYALFTPNMDQAVNSGEIVHQLQPACLSPCHGGEVFKPYEQFGQYIENWNKRKKGMA